MSAKGVERHGIDHLSASSLNLWAAQPALWITERLLGRKTPIGIPAAHGRAVEHGVHAGLIDRSKSPDECAAEAEREFNHEKARAGDPRRDEERAKIAGYVRGALAELRQYGIPDVYQQRIEIRLDGVSVPVIGFIATMCPGISQPSVPSPFRSAGSWLSRTTRASSRT